VTISIFVTNDGLPLLLNMVLFSLSLEMLVNTVYLIHEVVLYTSIYGIKAVYFKGYLMYIIIFARIIPFTHT